MQGAEVEVCEGGLLLGREAEGLGRRRQHRLQPRELAVEVADVRALLDGRQEGRRGRLGEQRFPVDGLKDRQAVKNTSAAPPQPSALSATAAVETKQGFVRVVKVTRKTFLPQRISPL